jgi:cytochrome c biogenesis protein CcmG, thiol:disulfide interchange protein DsbE
VTRIRSVALGVGIFVLALGVLFVVSVMKPQVESHGDLVGKAAPVVRLTKLSDGTPVTGAAQPGHVVVINFWNSWCIPCRQEQSALKTFYAEHRTDPSFSMIGVLRDDSTKSASTYATANKLQWTLVDDPHGNAAVAFGTTGQPETYVIGADGVVAAQLIGPATVGDLDKMLTAAQAGS